MSKVVLLKTYQAIELGKNRTPFTYLSMDMQKNLPGLSMKNLEIGIEIRVSDDGRATIVPFNNVAYFKLEEDKQVPVKKSEK